MTNATNRLRRASLMLLAGLYLNGCVVVQEKPAKSQAEAQEQEDQGKPGKKKPRKPKGEQAKPAPVDEAPKPDKKPPTKKPPKQPTEPTSGDEEPTNPPATTPDQGAPTTPDAGTPSTTPGTGTGDTSTPSSGGTTPPDTTPTQPGSGTTTPGSAGKTPIVVPAPPVSVFVPPVKPVPPPAASNLVVPVSVPMDDLVRQLDALIPATAKEDWATVNKGTPTVDVKYEVWRDPIKATLKGDTIEITVPLHYAANFRAKVKNPLGGWVWITKDDTWGTRSEPQHITATIRTKLGVSGEYQITADSKLDALEHGKPPSGKVCSDAIAKACVSKEELAPEIRKRLDDYLVPRIEKGLTGASAKLQKAFTPKKHAEKLWKAMQKPQSLDGAWKRECPKAAEAVCKEPAWLVVSPTAVGVVPPKLEGKDVTMALSVVGRVSVVMGKKPQVKAAPLPKLETVDAPAGIHVGATIQIPMASVSESLAKRLEGVKLGAKQQLVVKNAIVVSGATDKQPRKLTLQVALAGPVEATIYLQGEVAYDSASKSLTVGKLDYTVDTEDKFVKRFDKANHDAFRKELAGRTRIELGAYAGALEQAIEKALGGALKDQLEVRGELKQIEVQNISVKPDVLAVDLVLDGALRAKYTPR